MGLRIEVFTAKSALCTPVEELVAELACPNCEVLVHDLSAGASTDEGVARAEQYGVRRLPAVVVNGALAECCSGQEPITRASLLASVKRLR